MFPKLVIGILNTAPPATKLATIPAMIPAEDVFPVMKMELVKITKIMTAILMTATLITAIPISVTVNPSRSHTNAAPVSQILNAIPSAVTNVMFRKTVRPKEGVMFPAAVHRENVIGRLARYR
jgi:hypothetical protein